MWYTFIHIDIKIRREIEIMIFGALAVLMVIPLVLIFTIGIPIIIAVCVYRDADKRVDCSPWLWALVAALVPSYLGLIVYLIVRRDYPLKNPAGQTYHKDQTEENTYYQENYDKQAAVPKAGLPTWAKAVIIIGAVVVGICIIALVGSALYSVFGYNLGLSYYPNF